MKKKKIKVDDDTYNELIKMLEVGIQLEKTGRQITARIEGILSTLSQCGIEVPEKRMKKIRDINTRSVGWVNLE